MITMTRTLRGALTTMTLVAALPAIGSAQRIVYPGGPWVSDVRGSAGTAEITGTNPRSGNGSLELSVSGDLFDWGWFNLFSGDPATTLGWGQLASLTMVGFDWYRTAMTPTGDAPWEAQTPALRLYVRSGTIGAPVYSELVWERWYTLASPAPTNQWITENATDQMFWRYVSGAGYTINDCSNPPAITPGIPVKTASPANWGNGSNCYALGDAVVYGIGIGVGSNWPYQYQAFADNVKLGFNNDPNLTVYDNFELGATVTPEPATLILLGSGLAGVGGALARRRRRTGRDKQVA